MAARTSRRWKWSPCAPHAFIVFQPEPSVTVETLREFSRAHPAHFKTPHSFTYVTELPETATGNIQKYVLRAGRAAITPQ